MPQRMVQANIEADSFDRELFQEFVETSEGLSGLIERGSKLIPNFHALAQDVFAAFYKYNVILFPIEDVEYGSRVSRKLVERVLASEVYAELREETVLEGFNSALATITVLDRLLEWLRSEEGLSRGSLLKEWELAEAEHSLREIEEESNTLGELEQNDELEDSLKETVKRVRGETDLELTNKERELKELVGDQQERLERVDMKLNNLAESAVKEAVERVDDVERDLSEWGSAVGTGTHGGTLGQKLDLAEKLYGNEKLRRLSLLVGALKEEMFNTRRKAWSKRGSEVYEIGLGNDLAYLIPSEFVSLSNPLLKKDFLKKFIERGLLQYHLREERGSGPVIVCLDGSSSMMGDKEIWSKALTLSFFELAKRQKRAFSAIVFSSKGAGLKVFDSSARRAWGMTESQVLELADYFPGGGTDFESPLESALELLSEKEFGRADVLFITDGECDVSEDWLRAFLEQKSRLKFKVYSVLIDLTGRESTRSLEKFSDKVTAVSNLRSKDARRIFLEFE